MKAKRRREESEGRGESLRWLSERAGERIWWSEQNVRGEVLALSLEESKYQLSNVSPYQFSITASSKVTKFQVPPRITNTK